MQLTWILAPSAAQYRLAQEILSEWDGHQIPIVKKLENPKAEEWAELLGGQDLFSPLQGAVVTYTDQPTFSEAFFGALGVDDGWHVLCLSEKEPKKSQLPKDFWQLAHKINEQPAPTWPSKRAAWLMDLARNKKGKLDREAATVLVDWVDDPEELRTKLDLALQLAQGKTITVSLIEQLAENEGSRDTLKVLDAVANKDIPLLLDALSRMSSLSELIPLLSALQKRLRAAYYLSCIGRRAVDMLALTDYQARTAEKMARTYSHHHLALALGEVCRLSLAERRSEGEGFWGLQVCLLGLMA